MRETLLRYSPQSLEKDQSDLLSMGSPQKIAFCSHISRFHGPNFPNYCYEHSSLDKLCYVCINKTTFTLAIDLDRINKRIHLSISWSLLCLLHTLHHWIQIKILQWIPVPRVLCCHAGDEYCFHSNEYCREQKTTKRFKPKKIDLSKSTSGDEKENIDKYAI